ncbi:MAG: Xaa-Pro peptidase family protein [candidate division Zixibacteria bacterium]|nr:Xaa-Pro peptidase family protein [candidate division Zixibacteria bacterium]
MYRKRIKKVQKYIKEENLDGFIVSRLVSIRYLCGFSGTSGLLIIRKNSAHFLTDFRYKDQAQKQVEGAAIIITKGEIISELKELTQFHGKNLRYGYETEYLSCNDRQRLQNSLGNVLFLPMLNAVEEFSVVKDESEITLLKKAVDITDVAFERILGYLRPGLREREICAELEYQMICLGSEKPGFETIVASGFRSAMPHGVASDKKISLGDFVTFDFGATYKGYVADLTRTVVIGKATLRQKKIYNIVLRAQLAAIRKVRAGIKAKIVDRAARNVIEKNGYGKYFGHGLGHGIGIYIHSKPSVGPRSTDILKKGMVITIEPGIYLPGWGGVRIEDDVLVTTRGCVVLSKSSKKLLEV